MNHKQRVLTYVLAALFALSLFFVPWRVQDRLSGNPKFSYEFSPYWRPVIFDEGGALRPILLYVEWSILGGSYAVLYFCLKSKKERHHVK
jgi:hypothetical protein